MKHYKILNELNRIKYDKNSSIEEKCKLLKKLHVKSNKKAFNIYVKGLEYKRELKKLRKELTENIYILKTYRIKNENM